MLSLSDRYIFGPWTLGASVRRVTFEPSAFIMNGPDSPSRVDVKPIFSVLPAGGTSYSGTAGAALRVTAGVADVPFVLDEGGGPSEQPIRQLIAVIR